MSAELAGGTDGLLGVSQGLAVGATASGTPSGFNVVEALGAAELADGSVWDGLADTLVESKPPGWSFPEDTDGMGRLGSLARRDTALGLVDRRLAPPFRVALLRELFDTRGGAEEGSTTGVTFISSSTGITPVSCHPGI